MIKIEKPKVMLTEDVIRGARNAMNSWDRMDSYYTHVVDCETDRVVDSELFIGPNDYKLLMTLAKAGNSHAKYKRMIPVIMDITAPLYWWKEFDTYKIGTVANSCSTMHKLDDRDLTISDFSTEYLTPTSFAKLTETIILINEYRRLFKQSKDKRYWMQMVQLLPTSYNQKRTVMLNYQVLTDIYRDRKGHKLDEWRDLCEWIETLPYSELIIGERDGE